MNRNQTLLTGISLTLLALTFGTKARAQVAINTDASSPDASAMLDIKSTARGFLAPRMTSAQRTAIATPAEGLWVYDTDTKTFWYYLTGAGWQQFQGGGFTLPYSAVFSSASTLFSLTNSGSGGVYAGATTDPANVSNALSMTSVTNGVIADHSQGNAGNFFVNNTSGVGAGVRGEVNSIFGNNGTAGVYGTASGTGGYGGYFEHSNSTGFGYALMATSAGLGVVTHMENTNTANAQNTLEVTTNGTGSTGAFYNTNNTNASNTLYVTSNGPGVIADHSKGNAGNFFMNNTSGVGAGVRGEVNSIFGNNGTAGVYGVSSGTGGYGGYFEHTETTGYGIGVQIVNNCHGTGMVVDAESDGDLAIFQKGGFDKARIDNNGRGYFDGGTQNSGADLAEAFDVEGPRASYSPGDVLIISTESDRTLAKSAGAYSTLVAGVYATKPGVLLTEDSLSSAIDEKVPMGVVGVIPTKVCNENGTIHRGDILVTSSRPGYAMRADPDKLKPGQSIGKSLAEFSGETGLIKVLVNVK